MAIIDRVKSAWNAFRNASDEQVDPWSISYGNATYASPSQMRSRFTSYNDRYMLSATLNRISIDVASVVFRHVELDSLGRYLGDKDSYLNDCLTRDPNLDQVPRAFRQDIAMTIFYSGVAAIVPVDTAVDPTTNNIFDIYSLRVGEVVTWRPRHVRLKVYNEATMERQEVTLEKRFVALVENPLYSVMNEPNSTLQRLIRKLNQLDAVDEQSSSGKLDLIIQLPYVIKSEARRKQAEDRRKDIEMQLKGSQYGIAYTDGTEKITQLNRPAENNLMKQIEWLTQMFYGQLGITEGVMNGTADEATMINYWNRTIEPVAESIREAMHRAFLGPRNVRKREKIMYFKDPFKFVPVSELAEIGDKFTRNEIFTSNEMRGYMGVPPSSDPKADQLNNSNMPSTPQLPGEVAPPPGPSLDDMDSVMNEVFDGLSKSIDDLTGQGANG